MPLIYTSTSGINYTCDFSKRITTGAKDEQFFILERLKPY